MEHSLSTSRMSIHSSIEDSRKKDGESLNRPQSLIFQDPDEKKFENFSPPIERKSSREVKFNSLRKTKSLHNVDREQFFSPTSKSINHLNDEQIQIIEQFLKVNSFLFLFISKKIFFVCSKDYSTPYPITIHKVRPTLGVAIEGGFQDRIPLPRIVYMQVNFLYKND